MKNKLIKIFSIPVIFFIILFATSRVIKINTSKSEPLGIYLIVSKNNLNKNDYVMFKNNVNDYTSLAVKRNYMYRHNVFIKNITGITGDHIKITTDACYINGVYMGKVYNKDNKNRPLHIFMTNTIVPEHYYFVTSTRIDNSYDSRYYGLIPEDKIKARLIPLITF